MLRICIAGLTTVVVLVMSGMSTTLASAGECQPVKMSEPSTYSTLFLGTCSGKATTSGFVLTEGKGESIPGELAKIKCFKVEAGEPSSWKNSTCTEGHTGTGEYAKIEVSGTGGGSCNGNGPKSARKTVGALTAFADRSKLEGFVWSA